jgi:hypothetical protein
MASVGKSILELQHELELQRESELQGQREWLPTTLRFHRAQHAAAEVERATAEVALAKAETTLRQQQGCCSSPPRSAKIAVEVAREESAGAKERVTKAVAAVVRRRIL